MAHKLFAAATCIFTALNAQNFRIDRYEAQIKAFEKEYATQKLPKGGIVLWGSSSFANWGTLAGQMLEPHTVINRGFGGSTAAEALYYFERVVLPLKPKVIFYYEGENDLSEGFSVDSTFSNYLKLCKVVQKKLPGTYFIALSVKYSPARKHLNEKLKLYNGMVKGFAKANPGFLGYVDIVPLQLKHDGSFDPEMFTSDSLHVSITAYKKWALRMKEALKPLYETQKNVEIWQPLFNGENLEGWEIRGGTATYEALENAIVGTSTLNTPNSFLCTKKIYKDFILEFEVSIDTLLNSGVQFRSNSRPEYRNGVVHGYQCEIDPSPRAWSAGIYDEQRRGWIYKPENDPHAQKAFNRTGWNHYRIEAVGPVIKTFLNGKPVADIIDFADSAGFIGLQVHSIGDVRQNGAKVKWRNLKICEK